MTKKGEIRLCRLCGKVVKGDARKVFCSEKCRIKVRNKKKNKELINRLGIKR